AGAAQGAVRALREIRQAGTDEAPGPAAGLPAHRDRRSERVRPHLGLRERGRPREEARGHAGRSGLAGLSEALGRARRPGLADQQADAAGRLLRQAENLGVGALRRLARGPQRRLALAVGAVARLAPGLENLRPVAVAAD